MDRNSKKRILETYRELVRQEKTYQDALTYIRESLVHSPIYDGMPHGGSNKDLSDYVIRVQSLLDKLERTAERKHEMLSRILDAVETLPNEREKAVITSKYIDGKTFEKIAVETGRSYRQTIRIHSKAVNHINFEE